MSQRKGIILAGASGTRRHPAALAPVRQPLRLLEKRVF